MGKIGKNLLIGFTLICMIVFAVFVIELLVINSGSGRSPESEAPPSEGAIEDEPGASSGQQTVPGAVRPADPGQSPDTDQLEGAEPPPGTRFELEMPDDMILVMYVDEDLFSFNEMDSEDVLGVFTYLGSGKATLQIRFAYIPQGARVFAESFLNEFIGSGRSSVGDEDSIRYSQLHGVYVTGVGDGEIYEAWIYSFPGAEAENAGLAFVINYQDDQQKDLQKNVLYEILDTLDMVPVAGTPSGA